jgi:hypothetical protein
LLISTSSGVATTGTPPITSTEKPASGIAI